MSSFTFKTEKWVLTEVYEHLAVTLPHVLRHGEDAGYVVVQEGVFLLWEENERMKVTG